MKSNSREKAREASERIGKKKKAKEGMKTRTSLTIIGRETQWEINN
jgi:hypothetical protein